VEETGVARVLLPDGAALLVVLEAAGLLALEAAGLLAFDLETDIKQRMVSKIHGSQRC
jgi:hypothetical protein